jgi:hypothetical protein
VVEFDARVGQHDAKMQQAPLVFKLAIVLRGNAQGAF